MGPSIINVFTRQTQDKMLNLMSPGCRSLRDPTLNLLVWNELLSNRLWPQVIYWQKKPSVKIITCTNSLPYNNVSVIFPCLHVFTYLHLSCQLISLLWACGHVRQAHQADAHPGLVLGSRRLHPLSLKYHQPTCKSPAALFKSLSQLNLNFWKGFSFFSKSSGHFKTIIHFLFVAKVKQLLLKGTQLYEQPLGWKGNCKNYCPPSTQNQLKSVLTVSLQPLQPFISGQYSPASGDESAESCDRCSSVIWATLHLFSPHFLPSMLLCLRFSVPVCPSFFDILYCPPLTCTWALCVSLHFAASLVFGCNSTSAAFWSVEVGRL